MSNLKTRILFKLPGNQFASRSASTMVDVPRRGDECHVLGRIYVVESRRFYVGPESGYLQLLDAIGASSDLTTASPGALDAAAAVGAIRNLDPVQGEKPSIEIASAGGGEEIILIVLADKEGGIKPPLLRGGNPSRLSLAMGAAASGHEVEGESVSGDEQ